MLEARDIQVRYGHGRRAVTAVDGVSLQVPRGGTLGLVGESGSGKSTIARAIVGLVGLARGSILLDGTDCTQQRTRPEYRRRVQMVFQDASSSLNPRQTVEAMLAEVLTRRPDVARSARAREAARVLGLVGLGDSALPRYPHQFSGGQRQRVCIARALALKPDVVVLDEITSALDVSLQATILNLLKALQRELGLSYLIISHDLAMVGAMSDAVAVMHLGRVVETAETSALFNQPLHPYTQALLQSIPAMSRQRTRAPLAGDLPDPSRPPTGCRFHTRCPVGPLARGDRAVCAEHDPRAVADRTAHRAECHFAPPVEDVSPPAASLRQDPA